MKQLKVLWLAVGVWGLSILPSSAWVWGGNGTGGGGCRSFGASGRCAVRASAFRSNARASFGQFQVTPQFIDGRLLPFPSNCDGRNGRFGRNKNGRNCGNFNNGNDGFWGGGGFVTYDNSYPPGYRMDYSVNTPSPQSSSPYNIPLNNGVNISPLDPGYNGSGAAVAAGVQRSADIDLVVGVQRELRRRGFYGGAVNGVSDLTTRTAIRSYEASAGLPVTGQIGTTLLRSLGFM